MVRAERLKKIKMHTSYNFINFFLRIFIKKSANKIRLFFLQKKVIQQFYWIIRQVEDGICVMGISHFWKRALPQMTGLFSFISTIRPSIIIACLNRCGYSVPFTLKIASTFSKIFPVCMPNGVLGCVVSKVDCIKFPPIEIIAKILKKIKSIYSQIINIYPRI